MFQLIGLEIYEVLDEWNVLSVGECFFHLQLAIIGVTNSFKVWGYFHSSFSLTAWDQATICDPPNGGFNPPERTSLTSIE